VPMQVLRKYRKPSTPRKRDRFDLQIEGNHTYLVDHVVVHNSPETQPGGRALKFYSTQRLDIRRIETLKEGTEAVGNRVRVKVVKNKVAAPFRQAEFDIEYGDGISAEGCVLDLGLEHGIVQKSGSFFSYGEERLGQGRNNAKAYLREHSEVMGEIERKIYEAVGAEPQSAPLVEVDAAGGGTESTAEEPEERAA
jgi:recombination protein RecA